MTTDSQPEPRHFGTGWISGTLSVVLALTSCQASGPFTQEDVMNGLSPMGRPSTVDDIADAVLYLTDATTVTGEVLCVDGGAHLGRW